MKRLVRNRPRDVGFANSAKWKIDWGCDPCAGE